MSSGSRRDKRGDEDGTVGTFEGLAADVAAVGAALLVPAGLVAHQRAFLSETPLADVAGERTLAGVSPAVFVQTGCLAGGGHGDAC